MNWFIFLEQNKTEPEGASRDEHYVEAKKTAEKTTHDVTGFTRWRAFAMSVQLAT